VHTISASGSVPLNEGDFTIRRNLASATLAAEVELFDDISGAPLVVDVEAHWTSTGRLENSNSHFHSTSAGSDFNSHVAGRFRSAEASATVSDGTTEFTPEPATVAGIGSDNIGEVTVDR
jgi:hypothetical protein